MHRPKFGKGRMARSMQQLRRRRSDGMRRRPINVLASVMTTMNLYCGVSSIFATIGGDFQSAALFIAGAIFFDTFDGFVARLTHSTSEFGKELDSLCDIVSFGIAPAVMVFVIYLHESTELNALLTERGGNVVGKTGSYMAIIYAICTALRLARYNTFQSDRRDSFIGLPSPAAGGTIAAFILFLEYLSPRLEEHRYGPLAYYLLGPLAVGLAVLMVSTVLYPKGRLKSFVLQPRHAFIALGIYAFVIAIVHYAIAKSPYLVLFPMAMAYILFGIGDTIYQHFTRKVPQSDDTPIPIEDQSPGGAPSVDSVPKSSDAL